MTEIDVSSLTATEASSMCRFCMKRDSPTQPHYTLEWSKWPHADVSKLFERIIGQKLSVSSYLPGNFCSMCHAWLIETNSKIQKFQEVAEAWDSYLGAIKNQMKIERVDDEIGEIKEEFPDENLLEIEYLDVIFDTDEPEVSEDSPFQDEDNIFENTEDAENISSAVDTKLDARKQLDNRPIPSHWNANNAAVQCDICGMSFWRKYSIISHFSKVHGLHRKFSCESCPKMFQSKEAFSCHAKIHPPRSAFECCGRNFYSEAHLLRHQRSLHVPLQNWTCDLCAKVFISKQRLNNHKQRHGEKTHSCDECGRFFHMLKDVKLHKQTVHNDRPQFMCHHCGQKMTTAAALDSHNENGCSKSNGSGINTSRNHQIGRLPKNLFSPQSRPELRCSDCDFTCMRPQTLKRHFNQNHPVGNWSALAKLLCIRCMRQFQTVKESAEHFAKQHAAWQCDICKKNLTSDISLERHKKIHTAKARPFVCQVCHGTYVTMSQLKLHFRRRHTDERPFACPSCDKCYADKSEMNSHIRAIHNTGERLQCSYCNQTFSTTKYLQTHVARIHTGEFNFYQCPTCKGKFQNSHTLRQHQAVHHPLLLD